MWDLLFAICIDPADLHLLLQLFLCVACLCTTLDPRAILNRLVIVCSPSDRTAADLAHVVAIIGVRPFFRQFTVEKIEAFCSAIE